MNIRAKIPHATNALNSNKAHQRDPSAIIFCVVSLYTAKQPFSHHAVIIAYRLTK